MSKIAVFYHCVLRPTTHHFETAHACGIMHEQMTALNKSGLLEASSAFFVGINGNEEDRDMANLFVPSPNVVYLLHGFNVTSEIPTLFALQTWLTAHPDWYVCYHHIKGVSHQGLEGYARWRRRLENAVIWRWKECVQHLDSGFDSCGAHWLTPEQFPGTIKSPFWGGTFWWATARYLMTLPPLPLPTWQNRHEAESWIGYGPARPKVKDFCPGFPSCD